MCYLFEWVGSSWLGGWVGWVIQAVVLVVVLSVYRQLLNQRTSTHRSRVCVKPLKTSHCAYLPEGVLHRYVAWLHACV